MPKKQKRDDTDHDQTIVRMLGYLCLSTESEASLERKVEILDRFGLPDGDIAAISGSVVQSVRNARQAYKRLSHGRKKK